MFDRTADGWILTDAGSAPTVNARIESLTGCRFPRDLVRLARVPMMAECLSLSRMVESHPGLFAAR